jgi:isopentenyl-diphosphate delta-isomerase
MREELGIGGLCLTPLGQVEYRADVGGGLVEHEVVDVFLAELPERPEVAADPAEVAAIRWARLPEFDRFIAREPAAVTPWLKLYLSAHRDALFGPGDARLVAR